MEEDIKILEEKIKEWEPYKNIDFPTETGKLIQKENQAIENLIKGYRKLEDKLMYALSPTSHELAINTQEKFKEIIRENMDKDTYTIREKLKDYWDGDASKWIAQMEI